MLNDFDIDSLLNKDCIPTTTTQYTTQQQQEEEEEEEEALVNKRKDDNSGDNVEKVNGNGSIMVVNNNDMVVYDDDNNNIIPESIYPILENVIASVELIINMDDGSGSNSIIDLKKVAFKARNAEYNPRKVNAVVIRFREPKATAMLYGTGKVMVTGSNSEDAAKSAAKKVAKIVIKSGYPNTKFCKFKIENMVASADVRFPIRLEGLAYEHRSYCSYEPELYPGLVFRLFEPKVALLIFVSGKIVFTGAKNRQDISDAFRNIYPLLLKYQN